jgi:hypothetical protein
MLNVLFSGGQSLRRGFFRGSSASEAIALPALRAIGFDRQVDSVLVLVFLFQTKQIVRVLPIVFLGR